MKINIAYTRQSFQRSNTESSMLWQKQLITEHSLNNNYEIHEYYSDIKSGKDTFRAGFKSVLQRIKNDQVVSLTVYRIDRLYRNYRKSLEFFQLCAEKAIILHSLEDGTFNFQKPEERLALQVLSATAENQREQNVENRMANNKRKFENGLPVNYESPFGYRYYNHGFKIQPNEAKTVAFVYDSYLSGLGYKKISALSEEDPWIHRTPQQVKYILTNPKYYGDFVSKHGTLTDFLPQIITKKIYDNAQTIRKERAEHRKQKHSVDSKLRLKIICPYCSSKLTPFKNHSQHNSTAFYVCPKRLTGQYNDCQLKPVNLNTIEHDVQNRVLKFLSREKEIMQLYESIEETLQAQSEAQWQKGENYLKTKGKMIDQLARGELNSEIFKQWLADNFIAEDTNVVHDIKVDIRRVKKILQTDSTIEHELFQLVESVLITESGEVIDIRIEDIKENIINFKQEASL